MKAILELTPEAAPPARGASPAPDCDCAVRSRTTKIVTPTSAAAVATAQ